MKNDWDIVDQDHNGVNHVRIDGREYAVSSESAALCHCLMLLVDGVDELIVTLDSIVTREDVGD
jgi:hypothetical protein